MCCFTRQNKNVGIVVYVKISALKIRYYTARRKATVPPSTHNPLSKKIKQIHVLDVWFCIEKYRHNDLVVLNVTADNIQN